METANFARLSPPFELSRIRSLSIPQACVLLGVSRRTIYNWIRGGRLRTMRTIGGSQRILTESIRELAPARGHADPDAASVFPRSPERVVPADRSH